MKFVFIKYFCIARKQLGEGVAIWAKISGMLKYCLLKLFVLADSFGENILLDTADLEKIGVVGKKIFAHD